MSFLPEQDAAALRERFDAVIERLARAARTSDRDMADIRLIAISKTHPASMVAELTRHWTDGAPAFGENYVQEAVEKQKDVASLLLKLGTPSPEWHFTGHVQTRKAKDVTGRFALIHTLDSEKLAAQISKYAAAENIPVQPLLIQINIGAEPQKAGVPPEEAERFLDAIRNIERLRIDGLMCLPPFSDEAEVSRPFFVALRELRDTLRSNTGLALPHLSMGMSHDVEVAISEGATLVRVGTDIFGPRQHQA